MVATFCPDCGEWINGNWEDHKKTCPDIDDGATDWHIYDCVSSDSGDE